MDTLRENDNERVKKIDYINVEGNWEKSRPKKEWKEIIKEDMRACGLDKVKFRDRPS